MGRVGFVCSQCGQMAKNATRPKIARVYAIVNGPYALIPNPHRGRAHRAANAKDEALMKVLTEYAAFAGEYSAYGEVLADVPGFGVVRFLPSQFKEHFSHWMAHPYEYRDIRAYVDAYADAQAYADAPCVQCDVVLCSNCFSEAVAEPNAPGNQYAIAMGTVGARLSNATFAVVEAKDVLQEMRKRLKDARSDFTQVAKITPPYLVKKRKRT